MHPGWGRFVGRRSRFEEPEKSTSLKTPTVSVLPRLISTISKTAVDWQYISAPPPGKFNNSALSWLHWVRASSTTHCETSHTPPCVDYSPTSIKISAKNRSLGKERFLPPSSFSIAERWKQTGRGSSNNNNGSDHRDRPFWVRLMLQEQRRLRRWVYLSL